ncbi:MAG: hypothetical protein CL866_02060 [Cycloclasticus sp.]|nr:hypothetical protein [Cycloclasticus sp.]MBG95644.1 hypothetical protein [Cycloclasticus sp.]
MFSLKNNLVFIICFLLLSNAYSAEVTEAGVEELMHKVDIAVNKLDVDGVGAVLSDNVKITMNIDVQGQKQVLRPSKQEYLAMLKQGWTMGTDYSYSRSGINISISNNKAFVTTNVIESMTIQGRVISGTSREEAVVESVGNSILVTKIIGYTSL